jgi:outer membrane protein assembly factor BamB
VIIVVPVLMTSCQVSDQPKNGRFDPAIGPDRTIYVGHQLGPTGAVYALNGQGPAQKWVFPLDISGPLDFPGVFISAPVIGADGRNVFPPADKFFYVFEGNDRI